MTALRELPSIDDAQMFHLERWAEVCADAALRGLPDRIETNRFGHIIMTPPPGFSHGTRQFDIGYHLRTRLSNGRVFTECAVLTSDGVKGLDVGWISEARIKRGLKGEVLTIAPDICVEVISPKNTREEMATKRDLYFEAGAEEVWFCDRKGALHFFLKGGGGVEVKASVLCPTMPKQIKA